VTTLPQFAEFYEALHRRPPFPWQARLAAHVLERGWPSLLDLPTGIGKTSSLDVAIYCLAADPARMPRRTLLVVDRRIVVDQGADHAKDILARLAAAAGGPLRAVADALRALWGASSDEPPFAVAVMRGGMPRDNDWARRPDQPLLGVSTVDQVGSRLLFRGYGVGRRSTSIHAGLLGNDTLVLLDEVHLAVPFAQTLAAIRSHYRTPQAGLPDRFAVVEMSATPRACAAESVFGLDDADRVHPVVKQRLKARKLAALVTVKVTGDDEQRKREAVAKHAVKAALELQSGGAKVVGIVVNRVDTARLAYRMLATDNTTDAELVTGRMRPIERDRLVHDVLVPRAGAGRDRTSDRPLVVVATQCIEAGADLDFDGLITECASLDALRQRFGRVDRRGDLVDTRSVILGRSDLVAAGKSDPIYGGALATTWQWLQAVASDGAVGFGIDELPPAVGEDGVARLDVLSPVENAPVLLPAHIDAWSQTNPQPKLDPDISLWLHGPRRELADVQIVWRADLAPDTSTPDDLEELVEQLEACRPSALEAVTVPLGAAKRWLANQPPIEIADTVAGPVDGAGDEKLRYTQKIVALRWNGEDSDLVNAEMIEPGDVLVVGARGGLTARSFDPENASDPVIDLGDVAQLRGRGIATLRIGRDTLAAWDLPPLMLDAMPEPVEDEDPDELRARVQAWLSQLPVSAGTGFVGSTTEWSAARRAWLSPRMRVISIGPRLVVVAPVPRSELRPELAEALTEDDDSSFRQREITLSLHSSDVREHAERYARAVGFAPDIVADVALAGWLHDIGKADPRFQSWLVGGSEVRAAMLPEPLAKSALPAGNAAQRRLARRRARYPDGCRHELMSLEMIRAAEPVLSRAHDRDLVMHLVASHHGWCRPFPPPTEDPDDMNIELHHGDDVLRGATRHRLARLDSGIAERFWNLTERYGWWGLAWLEAVLRLADHRASERATEGNP